jgi:hypothetical protein
MGLMKRRDSLFRREAQYEVVFQNAATHPAVDHERKPSEHLPFGKLGGAPQDRPNAVPEMNVIRHDYFSLALSSGEGLSCAQRISYRGVISKTR